MAETPASDMKSLKEELDRILEAVSDEELPLDTALDFYEQAVKLGMKATELMESGLADVTAEADASDGDVESSETEAAAPEASSSDAAALKEASADQGGE